jgi:histidyl-tRNA synthetase
MRKTTPTGFPDLLPEKAIKKEKIVSTITDVYRRFGFVPLETPVVEFQDVLIDEQTDFNLFQVSSSRERASGEADPMAMRFDLTVPLSRVVAQYPELVRPFKRYQFGTVFRGERPQKGRYRQFSQLDADIVGSASIFADIEVISMMREVMYALIVPAFTIRVNTRNVLNALPYYANFPTEKLRDVLIVLDKRDKISKSELQELLIKETSVSEASAELLIEFGGISGKPMDVMNSLEKLFGDLPQAVLGLQELRTLAEALETSEHGDSNITFDMSIIRGLAYYTGPVFETTLDDAPELGSVYSGGRYDNLIGKYLGNGQNIPAVGASVGVDRLLAVLEELELRGLTEKTQAGGSIVLVQDDTVLDYAFQIASKVRSQGQLCDLYLGKEKNLGKQFAYAESKNLAQAFIVGEDEQKKSTIIVKNLITREQQEIAFNELTEFLLKS